MEKSLEITDNWPKRSEYWTAQSQKITKRKHYSPRNRHPLILNGHGVALSVDRGTLFCRNGFTHYPQNREEFRYFRGDPDLPTRIIISNASGVISFSVLHWLSEQKIPLIQLSWDGDPIIVSEFGYSANAKIVATQYKKLESGAANGEFANLIMEKLENSISTLSKLRKDTNNREAAISQIRRQQEKLRRLKDLSNANIQGIEGQAAAAYFDVWRGISINWHKSKRAIIPADWTHIGGRRSALGTTNRNARHPINAMLNYAYAVLFTQVKIQLLAKGFDPSIGLSHAIKKYRDALVLDYMEPLRPVVDAIILDIIFLEKLSASDFNITQEGYCRLNPQFAKLIAQRVEAMLHSHRARA